MGGARDKYEKSDIKPFTFHESKSKSSKLMAEKEAATKMANTNQAKASSRLKECTLLSNSMLQPSFARMLCTNVSRRAKRT